MLHPAVPRRSLATPLKSNKTIHLHLRLQQLLKSNWKTLGILCSPWALADVRCLILTLHCHSCKLQLTEWKHRNSNPEKNGCIILERELWLPWVQTQAVSKVGSKQRKSLMRPVPAVSARGRKPWLAAHWSIVWVCIGSDFPGHEIRSWVILKMSCYFKLFFNLMFDMSSHIYLGKLCFTRTPTVQPLLHSWCWGWGWVLAESRHCPGDNCTARHCPQVPTQRCLDFGKRNAYIWLWACVFFI